MYAQESNGNEYSVIDNGLDINGLRPEDYDLNGWAQLPNGTWVPSPVGAKYSIESNWNIYDVIYNAEKSTYNLIFGQQATGKSIDSQKVESNQNIFVNVLLSKKIISSKTDTGDRKSYYFSFSIKPDGEEKSLHKTFFDREEDGFLILKDSKNEPHTFNVKVKPGSFVTVYATGVVNTGVSENKNKPKDYNTQELISVLQNNEKVNATIQGKNNEWSCNFDIIGNLPKVYENLTATKELSELSTEKADMSTGAKVTIGVLTAIAVAAAIYIGIKMDDKPGATDFSQAASGAASRAAPNGYNTVKEIAEKMQKASDASSKTGALYPNISYWNKMITENLSTRFHKVPPELLDDYIEGIRQAASELVK
jgi:hypothetical protein